MKALLSNAWGRYLLAAFAGVMLATTFLQVSIQGLAWVAPGLMIVAALGTRGWETFRIGFVAGLGFWLTSLYWVLLIPVNWFPILGWVAMSAYLALFPAVWVKVVFGFEFRVSSWSQRTLWALTGAAVWVALEMVRARLLGGFPWNLIGVSQYRLTPLIQIASVTGVYGISFLIVWTSLSLLNAVRVILNQPSRRLGWQSEIILPFVVVVCVFTFGFGELRGDHNDRPTLRVTLIQPSIPQTVIWSGEDSERRFAGLLGATSQALTNRTDLIIWPEAAVPNTIRYDAETYEAITSLARSYGVWMIVGSDDKEPSPDPEHPDDILYFNASFLVSPSGELVARYCKRNLVIFGEYVPFSRQLPFLRWLTGTGGDTVDFSPGDKPVPFELERRAPAWLEGNAVAERAEPVLGAPVRVKTSTLICFEDIFPHLAPSSVDDDTDFLVNLTNDGWFGESGQQWQHMANAIFRTVENGVPLLRCCNNGISCWIDSHGRVQQIFRDETGSVYGTGSMTAQIPLLNPDERRPRTFYNQHGDWFGWGCVLATVVMLVPRLKMLGRNGKQRRVIS